MWAGVVLPPGREAPLNDEAVLGVLVQVHQIEEDHVLEVGRFGAGDAGGKQPEKEGQSQSIFSLLISEPTFPPLCLSR